ncbi:D-erythronate dehydrogenase [Amnibacterium sp.]|uniref:D-erythronate dehydrogenase n=1 Tax=Amnibacterium sp. TaxID=1872496 RepID=UPI003F7B9818
MAVHDPAPGVRVVVTGGAGFLGTMLVERLLQEPSQTFGGSRARVAEIVVLDLQPPLPRIADDPRVRVLIGPLEASLAAVPDADVVFHLAGVVSGAAEADFDLGMRTNLEGTRAVLEWARAMRVPPLLVFASSLAVFGSDPAIGPIGEVDDDTMPRPQSSYGTQKLIGELLVADCTRKGFVRGRSVRLMTVSVRPGKANAAASSFLSGIIREPIAGLPSRCPVPPDTPVALSSPARTIEGVLAAAAADEATWGSRTAMNLPALATTPREMAAALDRAVEGGPSRLIEWSVDPEVERIVASWPARIRTDRAAAMGLTPDGSFDDVVAQYLTTLAGATR